MRYRNTFLAAAIVAATATAGLVGHGQAQSRTWYVWINVSTNPATIGVADASYNVPGWRTLAGPFSSDRSAWVEACRLHRGAQYHSPDIAGGRIFC
jgi:hypothetical protein